MARLQSFKDGFAAIGRCSDVPERLTRGNSTKSQRKCRTPHSSFRYVVWSVVLTWQCAQESIYYIQLYSVQVNACATPDAHQPSNSNPHVANAAGALQQAVEEALAFVVKCSEKSRVARLFTVGSLRSEYSHVCSRLHLAMQPAALAALQARVGALNGPA